VNEKQALRKQVLSRRDALGAAERLSLSQKITADVLALPSYQQAACVLAYSSIGSEFDTSGFVADARARAKRLVFPRAPVGARMLELYAVRDLTRDLAAGVWGIREPRADICDPVSADEIDFVLVPGVAFTSRCERLGYGKGFYDRLIGELSRRPPLVAPAFELQIVPALPISPTDQPVDLIITEESTFRRESHA